MKRKRVQKHFQSNVVNLSKVRYNLKREILKLKTIGATIKFINGDKPISKFTLLERHFYKNHLLKSFVFDFGFLIPDSENSAEQIYEVNRQFNRKKLLGSKTRQEVNG